MKKTIFFGMLGAMAMLASCSQNEDMPGNNPTEEKAVTFSLQTQQPLTRAAGDGLRYVVAIYDEAGTTEVKDEQTFGETSFSIMLAPGKYTCLFWADYGDANYDAADLTSVSDRKNTAADANSEAFFAKQAITVTDGSAIQVELKRAVAQVVLKENNVLEAGTLKVTFDRPTKFNVNDGTTSETVSGDIKNITFGNKLDGTTTPVEIGSFYVLAPTTEAHLENFKIQYNGEAERKIVNVPMQANYKTNITGKYGADINQQFAIDVNTEWGTPDKESFRMTVGVRCSHTDNDYMSRSCIVVSSTITSAVICGTLDVGRGEITNKAAAISDAAAKGGRLVTFAEFSKLKELGIIYDNNHYYCADYERCWSGEQVTEHDNIPESNLNYYIAFDITE